MTMELVNGIACYNCTDVEKAKKAGLNGTADTQDPLHPSIQIAAPKTGGVDNIMDSPNQPLASGNRGTLINMSA